MGLPDKPIKHVARHQEPIGSRKKGKIKVRDGNTGKVSWRSAKRGMVADYDGDPISTVYANSDMAISHKVKKDTKRAAPHLTPKGAGLPDLPEE